MNTQILDIFDITKDKLNIEKSAEVLKNGDLVVIPTETVYGLAANALDENAVKKIYEAKGRPSDNPLIVHIASLDMLKPLVLDIPKKAMALAEKFWPGPLTMIFKKSDIVPSTISGGLDTVAVRFPKNEVACEIIKKAGVPLAAPSANLSGSPSPTTSKHVISDLSGRVDVIINSHDCEVGLESTVVLITGDVPVILRPGQITADDISSVVGDVLVDKAITSEISQNEAVLSPGMKYKHYAPKANITILDGDTKQYTDYVNQYTGQDGVYAICFDEDLEYIKVPYISLGSVKNKSEQAHNLFKTLRELDDNGAKRVFAHAPDKDGVGLAVYNRLIRAASFEVIYL